MYLGLMRGRTVNVCASNGRWIRDEVKGRLLSLGIEVLVKANFYNHNNSHRLSSTSRQEELKQEKKKSKHTSRPSQIPRPTRPAINPTRIEILLREEIPALTRINQREIGIQNPFPPALNCGRGVWSGWIGGVEYLGPFLGYEGGRAREGGVGEEREHVDSVNVFSVGAEVGGCVDFVFKELNG